MKLVLNVADTALASSLAPIITVEMAVLNGKREMTK